MLVLPRLNVSDVAGWGLGYLSVTMAIASMTCR
jgi:hypothetical protein